MNPALFKHFERELQHIREMSGEFAREYPKMAGRLGLESQPCADPYVERLLEGFAYLTARVQLNIDNNRDKLARNLLEMIYPNYLSPVPSMLIAQLNPSRKEGSLLDGFPIPHDTRLRGLAGANDQTECYFHTAHDLTLWPLKVTDVQWLSNVAAINAAGAHSSEGTRSALAIHLSTEVEIPFEKLSNLHDLTFHVCGADNAGAYLYEQILQHTRAVSVVSGGKEVVPGSMPEAEIINIARVGFADEECLLPAMAQGFQGHRLLQEYFCLPERFHFFRLDNLLPLFEQVSGSDLQLILHFGNVNEQLAKFCSADNIRLNCVPAINLFEKAVDRIHIERRQHEYHVVPDKTNPLDYEIFGIKQIKGHGSGISQEFFPFYNVNEKRSTHAAFYSLQREPRRRSTLQKLPDTRRTYNGSEVFISLVDADEAPYNTDLKQLSVRALCTNRDLPNQMPRRQGKTDFSLDISAPVESIRCIKGPTAPKPAKAHGSDSWRLVSLLNMNYLSIADSYNEKDKRATAMLRQMLELFIDAESAADKRQLDGIVAVDTKAVVRPRAYGGRLEIIRGMQIRIRMDETAFEGTGVYLLGSVLERYFARYASINSFTETVLETMQKDEIKRWPVRPGDRLTI